MKRLDFRIIVGSLLILAGIFALLDKTGIVPSGMDLFWGTVFGVAGLAFLYIFFTERSKWWAAIPGFSLLGIGASALLPDALGGWDSLATLGGISLGFWAVYSTGRERWWAIIPAGVLLTLGLSGSLSSVYDIAETGGVFFLGLGLTFLLVAILPGPAGRNWAFIPAAVLLVLGVILGAPFQGVLDYIWIAALFLGGLYLIYLFFRKR